MTKTSANVRQSDEHNKKHVLVLTSTYQSGQTGEIPGFVNRLCEQISQKYKVTVLTQHCRNEELVECIRGIEIHRFRYAPQRYELLSGKGGMLASIKRKPIILVLLPFFLCAQVVAIRKLCNTTNPGIIHAHWIVPQGFAALTSRALQNRRPPIVLTAHGGDLYGLNGYLMRRLKQFLLNRVDHICVVSSSMKAYIRKGLRIDTRPVSVFPMGSELSSSFVPNRNQARDQASILFVGRLVEKKGVSDLIRAFDLASQQAPDLTLRIVGDGPELSNLRNLAGSLNLDHRVEFVGAVPHDLLPEYYQRAEIAVFPFVQAGSGDMEGLGLVVVEAMGCETPVIVGDVPAIHDTVINNETGLIFESGNYRDLAEQIVLMHNDSELRSRLGVNSRKYVQDKFSWDVCAERYMDLFDKILSGNRELADSR